MIGKFECEKGHVFLHVAKMIHNYGEISEGKGPEAIFEEYVCPECKSNKIKEHIETPIELKGEITALISVPNNDVNKYLLEGYKVMEDKIYAKETILVKRAEVKPKEQPDPDDAQAFTNPEVVETSKEQPYFTGETAEIQGQTVPVMSTTPAPSDKPDECSTDCKTCTKTEDERLFNDKCLKKMGYEPPATTTTEKEDVHSKIEKNLKNLKSQVPEDIDERTSIINKIKDSSLRSAPEVSAAVQRMIEASKKKAAAAPLGGE